MISHSARVFFSIIAATLLLVAAGCGVGPQVAQSVNGPQAVGQHPAGAVQPHVLQSSPPDLFVEFPIPTASSQPEGIAIGSDRLVYFTEFAGNKVGRIDQTGAITEFPIPTLASGPSTLATDRTALWFVETQGNKLGRLNTSGGMTEFTIPTPASGLYGICWGEITNAMWFTESAANKIGKILTTGQIIEYPLPNPGSQPAGIKAAANGDLWFAELGAARLGHITRNGVITEYPIPAPAQEVNKADNGDIYFSMPSRKSLGEMTTGGVYVTEHPTGLFPSQIGGLFGGKDHIDIWYTDHAANAILSFNTSDLSLAVFTATTPNAYPYDLTMARDQNLWFTERDANNIGVYVRLRMTVTPSSLSFSNIGAQQTFSVVERKYNLQFIAFGCSPDVATVTPGPATTFTVTAKGHGSCTITVEDNAHQLNMSNVQVTVQ